MTRYSDDTLEAMLLDIESDLAERKETFKGEAPTTARQAVCAFANDLADHGRAGVLFIGARDDGTPTQLAITDELLRALADIKTDGQILPPPTLSVEKRRLRGADLGVVTVEPSDSPPVHYKGRVYIRVGPRRAIANPQDERILGEKRRHRDRPFDVQPLASGSIADLNLRLFEEEYLPSAVAPAVLAANERTLEQRLAVTKMIVAADDLRPTVLGALVLGVRTRDFIPGAYVQFLRIAGTQLADPVSDESVLDGTVTEVLKRVDEKFRAHNRTAVDFTSDEREQRQQPYPIVALQQLVRNAVMHRTYEATHAPVRAYWYDDRIEITNPGGPFGFVTRANFGTPGAADYRNPNLAEALKVLGFVQQYGVGIATVRRELEKNGNPQVEFQVEDRFVGVTLRPAT